MHQPAMFFMWLCTLCGSCWECKDVRCPFSVRRFTASPGKKKYRKISVACCMDFLCAVGKQAKGLIWKQGEDESWRLPTSPHPPNLIVCIKIGVAPYYPPPSPYPLPHLHLFFKCWLNKAMAQLEKMKKKKGWKGWPFVLRSFVQLTHPPTASRGSTSSL